MPVYYFRWIISGALSSMLALAWSISSSIAYAECPIILHREDLSRISIASNILRKRMKAFVRNKNDWRNVSLQIDTFDDDGYLIIPDDSSYLEVNLTDTDRFLLRPEVFTSVRAAKNMSLPCGAKNAIEVTLPNGRYAYLMECRIDDDISSRKKAPIDFTEEKRKVESSWFRYVYDERNHLLFRNIEIKNNKWLEVARDAEQYISADIKNFFTLKFGSDDINAKLDKYWHGSVSLMGLLKFYLKVLAFEVEFSLTPEVQFFDKAVYMPMNMSSPLNLKSYLNQGSGMMYSWLSPRYITWSEKNTNFPLYGQPHSLKDFCKDGYCKFQLSGNYDENNFSLDFVIPKSLVDLGFYPRLFVGNIPKLYERNIPEHLSKEYQMMGVYFEVSNLPKGDNNWDFWVRFGKTNEVCPSPVELQLLNG